VSGITQEENNVALINCPECNKEISDKAGACPSCGHPMEKQVLKPIYQKPKVTIPKEVSCLECGKEISTNSKACPYCECLAKYAVPEEYQDLNDQEIDIYEPKIPQTTCPSCKSENTQKIEVMVMNGTTSGSSTAIGVTSHLDLGVARIKSSSQTTLASTYVPPKKPVLMSGYANKIMSRVMFVVSGAMWYFTRNEPAFFSYIFGGFTILLALGVLATLGDVESIDRTNAQKLSDWEKQNNLFKNGWMCHRCGHKWNS
jgi:hypothetical protein